MRRSLPSVFITAMWPWCGNVPSSAKWMYAMRVPSGETEAVLADSSSWVSRFGSAPSASTSNS